MKTKNSILTALMVVLVSGMAFAMDPGNPKLVVINQKSGVFKVIYEGAKAGKVTLKIYDSEKNVVFAEDQKNANGFIRPVNFDGMKSGEYTIEIADAFGKHTQKVTYGKTASIKRAHIAKTSQEGKYLLAVANRGNEVIHINIYDGSNNLVHTEQVAIDGDFGKVYDLKRVAGVPTFEVSDKSGNLINQ